MHLSSYDVVKSLFIKLCMAEPIIHITTVAILAQGTHWADAAKQAFFSQGMSTDRKTSGFITVLPQLFCMPSDG
jgi:hypothetical protein